MAFNGYNAVVSRLSRPKEERRQDDLRFLESWFRQKSKLFRSLSSEVLLDVIQNCEFVKCQPDALIIHQGQRGNRLYIILKGNVSIVHKDALEDIDLGLEDNIHHKLTDRSSLGIELVRLGDGATFGEIALINPDCIRTASVITNTETDLVVIERDLFNRSISKVVAKAYAEKLSFVESCPLFRNWSMKWKKHLAASLVKEHYTFGSQILKQGNPANSMYFIVKGEVKLYCDPEDHYYQFDKVLQKSEELLGNKQISSEKAHYPTKILPQVTKYARVVHMQQKYASGYGEDKDKSATIHLPHTWSPSAVRKLQAEIKCKKSVVNLCLLGEKQIFGELELVLGIDKFHMSAECTQDTVVMSLLRTHYDRLFQRRNPQTARRMAETIELQLARRLRKPNITEAAPLLYWFTFKAHEIQKDNGKKFLSTAVSPQVDFTLPNICLVSQPEVESITGSNPPYFKTSRLDHNRIRNKAPITLENANTEVNVHTIAIDSKIADTC